METIICPSRWFPDQDCEGNQAITQQQIQYLCFCQPFCLFQTQSPWGKTKCLHSGTKEIFFLKERATAFPTPAQQPQRKINKPRQRWQLGERSQCCGTELTRSSLPTWRSFLCSSSRFSTRSLSNYVFYTLGNSLSDSDCWGLCLCCYLSVYILRFAFLALKLNHSIIFGTDLGETFPNNGYTMQLPVSERVQLQENFKSQQSENSVGILLAF